MDTYTLYLDESKSENEKMFVVGGAIINNADLNKLDNMMSDVKRKIWDEDYISLNSPILHCTVLSTIYHNRKNKNLNRFIKDANYSLFNSKNTDEIIEVCKSVYSELSKTLKSIDATIIACLVDLEAYNYLYKSDETIVKKNMDSLFEVAMQEIVENFTHFLIRNNAIGHIVYESRNGELEFSHKSSDVKMYDNFCKIKSCNKGISYLNNSSIIEKVRFLSIYSKRDDVSGLQLADFIAYNILKLEQKATGGMNNDFLKKIKTMIYNGGYDLADKDVRYYFGIKKIPFDYLKIDRLQSEVDKLKISLADLKKERNRLQKDKEILTRKKDNLIAKLNNMQINIDDTDRSDVK